MFDNIFVERRWRAVKCEEVSLHECESVLAVWQGLDQYFPLYNHERLHQALNHCPPD